LLDAPETFLLTITSRLTVSTVLRCRLRRTSLRATGRSPGLIAGTSSSNGKNDWYQRLCPNGFGSASNNWNCSRQIHPNRQPIFGEKQTSTANALIAQNCVAFYPIPTQAIIGFRCLSDGETTSPIRFDILTAISIAQPAGTHVRKFWSARKILQPIRSFLRNIGKTSIIFSRCVSVNELVDECVMENKSAFGVQGPQR
jgi:hypothetical protein